MINRTVAALKSWADEHREWIIIGVALPAGTAAGEYVRRTPTRGTAARRLMRAVWAAVPGTITGLGELASTVSLSSSSSITRIVAMRTSPG